MGPRWFAAKWIAFYTGEAVLGGLGVIAEAQVLGYEVAAGNELQHRVADVADDGGLRIVYRLEQVHAVRRPIDLEGSIVRFRWASRLSLNRSQVAAELYLETEAEWRLYEELVAQGIEFRLRPGDIRVVGPNDMAGRAVLEINGCQVRYEGAAGFVIRSGGENGRCVVTVRDVIKMG